MPAEVHADTKLPSAIKHRLVQAISSGSLELPMLPEVPMQVMQACNNESCTANKLAELIRRDQALAANLLRISNSPLYAPVNPIVSLDQALARLGMKKICEIALIVSCQGKVFNVPGHEARVHAMFEHALAAAAYAQEIARSRRWNVEESFLCGLMHDVGEPVLLQALVDLHAELKEPLSLPAVEHAIAILHPRVGAALITGWKLPARLGETILHHHEPTMAESCKQTALMTSLADDLAYWTLGGRTDGPISDQQLIEHPTLEPLNLYPEELDALMARKDAVKSSVHAIA